MRVSTMVRLSIVTPLMALGACADSATGPGRAITADELETPSLGKSSGNVAYYMVDSNTIMFTIDPTKRQTVGAGGNSIVFPAHSVCDPEVSGYGQDLWDTACKSLTKPITITASWTYREGHALVEFEPALRFAPAGANEQDKWVILTLQEKIKLNRNATYQILWRAPDGQWIDESLNDPTMRAWTDKAGNKVSRRIKHFSGYNVTAGFMGGEAEVSTEFYW
jgi:hypothetical protein